MNQADIDRIVAASQRLTAARAKVAEARALEAGAELSLRDALSRVAAAIKGAIGKDACLELRKAIEAAEAV